LQPRTVCASIVARNGRSIAVLGATGYTGRLIAAELSRHGAALLLAGRNSGKLAQLAEQIGGAETSVTDVRDGGALDALAQRAQVLINCVGPFLDYGEPVVRAAIAAGAHYLDTTGEQPFVRSVLVHDTWAEAQGVAVVPALAFEVAVADCGAALAAEGFDRVESVRVTYVTRLQASQGTKRSVLRMLQAGGFAYADGQWVEEEPGRQMIFLDLPEPVGRVAAISFPSAEVITIPRHVEASTVRAFLAVPRIAARVLSASGGAIGALARSPLALLGARFIGDGTAGPSDEARRHDSFHVAVEVRGSRRGKPGAQRLVLRGRDVYGLTAAIARQGALLLAAGRVQRHGVLAPAQAFKARAFLDGLQAEGLAYEFG
jgi:short subunit dehydrogenase-like uncharacterized protein